MDTEKKISHETYLKALGLFTLMCQHADEATKYDDTLRKLLGYTEPPYYSGHISDHCYAGLNGYRPPFMELLKREGFEVEEPMPAEKRKAVGYMLFSHSLGTHIDISFPTQEAAEAYIDQSSYSPGDVVVVSLFMDVP